MTNARNKFQSSRSTNLGHPSKWMQQVVDLLLCRTKNYIHHHHHQQQQHHHHLLLIIIFLLLHHHHHHHHHHHLAQQTHLNIAASPPLSKHQHLLPRTCVRQCQRPHCQSHWRSWCRAPPRPGILLFVEKLVEAWVINKLPLGGWVPPKTWFSGWDDYPPCITAIKRSFKEGVPQPQEWGTEN